MPRSTIIPFPETAAPSEPYRRRQIALRNAIAELDAACAAMLKNFGRLTDAMR